MSDVKLPRCARLPLAIDLEGLLQALQRVTAESWLAHFNSSNHQGEWSGVALVTSEDALLPLAPGQGAAVHLSWWQQEAAWQAVLAPFLASLQAARLLRLGAGAQIHEHRDPDLGRPGGCLRLHVPLLSPPGVEFLVDGLQVPMGPGECWFIDLSRPHRVSNPGPGERVHLVLDCIADAWLLGLIEQGRGQTPALRLGKAGQAFEQFRLLVAQDPALAARLQRLEAPSAFVAEAIGLGVAQGLVFTEAEVLSAMRQGKRAWSDQWRA
ncbi:MAG: aspartyl/asparaginyl beta-hydroxylase domain-containing protein [Candidatus Pseudomonas phytovorans]|uniref:Aspartyl/asparaginyl beta-hydroxylase domain-containing protein n=1 Tax=Candidatus Pseudomonas phytovorans TaxID=3121377 RepID=A0AAJ6BCX7_9PSED|nr:aspartyl/asparaginyl beta-hydroxylase domain-containing protein [Pseudomonas sp.]WEK32358.1 MAG: aspartyl/asparaginyl beta-hydroxylase domain-containing protein [Pseudomonas sp.]